MSTEAVSTDQAKRLLERAARLPGAVRTSSGRPWACCSSCAKGWPAKPNDPMVELEARTDGTGRASFTVRLDRDDPFLEN